MAGNTMLKFNIKNAMLWQHTGSVLHFCVSSKDCSFVKRNCYVKSFCSYTEYPSLPDLLYRAESLWRIYKPTINADHLLSLSKDGTYMLGCEAKRCPVQTVQVKKMGVNIVSLEHLWPCPELIFLITRNSKQEVQPVTFLTIS